MVAFTCRTRDGSGSVVEKTIEAGSQREALMRLEEEGLFPIEIVQARGRRVIAQPTRDGGDVARARPRGRRVKRKEILRFSIQLASSIDAGVPMLTALESIRLQTTDKALLSVLREMIVDIKGGLPLSAAVRKHPGAFAESYAGTIAAGEDSGSLDEVLNNLAEYLEAEMEVIADVRSALIYPAIVIATLGAAIGVLLVFVVPRFAAFYSGFDAELPMPTQVLIATSTFLANNFLLALAGLGALGYAAREFIRTPRGRFLFDTAVLRIPVLGSVVETAVTLQAVQMIGLFSQAGVALLQGLETIASTTTNSKMRRDLVAVSGWIAAGETLTDSLEAAKCFPPAARQMLANGEATGSLERACFAVAKHYKKELHYLTKNLATMIEPLLTLVLAAIVLFVALAAFLPMWDLVKVVG